MQVQSSTQNTAKTDISQVPVKAYNTSEPYSEPPPALVSLLPPGAMPTARDLHVFDTLLEHDAAANWASEAVIKDHEVFLTDKVKQRIIARASTPTPGRSIPQRVLDASLALKKCTWPGVRSTDRMNLCQVLSVTDADPLSPNKYIVELYSGVKKRNSAILTDKWEANSSFYVSGGMCPGDAAVHWILESVKDIAEERYQYAPLLRLQLVENYDWAYQTFPAVKEKLGDRLMELVKYVRLNLFSLNTPKAQELIHAIHSSSRSRAQNYPNSDWLAADIESEVLDNFIPSGYPSSFFTGEILTPAARSYISTMARNARTRLYRKQKEQLLSINTEQELPARDYTLEQVELDDLVDVVDTILGRVPNKQIARAIRSKLNGVTVPEALREQGLPATPNTLRTFYRWKRILRERLKTAI